MEHLDLAGVLTTPPQWNLPAFEQQDAIYLSSSRQMLEPIMEETSEDEEYALNSWPYQEQQNNSESECGATTEGESLCGGTSGAGGASFWSSAESDTGSVIRIEVNKDNDSTSERDFLCPAKRPRRCEESLLAAAEEEVILRRPFFAGVEKNNSLERFLNYENFSRDSWGANSQQRSSVGSRRGFDDFYSDSDSLSYNSLSRSSSLIQFESLERQLLMQEQHASMNSLGNSSPSLLSFETQEEVSNKTNNNSGNSSANNSRRGSQSSLLKKYESLDGRLHQTYYDLDKLNFDDMDNGNNEGFSRNSNLKLQTHMAELRSDSESSSEGSEGSSRLLNKLSPGDCNDTEFLFKKFNRCNSQQSKKGKSSAENLSEDSGYCEPSLGFGLRRSKSQTLLKNYEKFSEEEEEMENKSLIPQHYQKQMFNEQFKGQAGEDILELESHKHSFENEFKNINNCNININKKQQTPPHSPHLEYIRHKQRSETHSPSPVSSELSTSSSTNSNNSSTSSSSSSSASSSSSSATSTSSATTCASKASFTWLKATANATKPPLMPQQHHHHDHQHYEQHEAEEEEIRSYEISLNDLCEQPTSNKENVENFTEKLKLLEEFPLENENLLNENVYCLECGSNLKEFESLQECCEKYRKFCSLNNQKCLEHNNRIKKDIHTNEKPKINTKNEKENCGEFVKEVYFEKGEESIEECDKIDLVKCSCRESSCVCKENFLKFNQFKEKFENNYYNLVWNRKYYNLMPHWPNKTSSLPNELNTLGRKRNKRFIDNNTEFDSFNCSREDLRDNCFINKRSLSWCYQLPASKEDCPLEFKNLAIIHQSYHNLAALDLDTKKMSDKRISSDYETEIVCKNNFLLDELSAHYDRTASILNDQPIDQVDNVLSPPKAPHRQNNRKLSQSSCSAGEESENDQVQHVQMVIRKPPARQKRNQQQPQDKTNSLTQDFTFSSIMQGGLNCPRKTFDQDPTILKTSYAQSLEKCNFDCKELSTQDLSKTRSLPKRRFQSQANNAKKKSLVSSTPNLNAYDFHHQDEIEDDMFVSSAHTSMHQLNMGQTQKPLGILLPAGSRTSFGKEVSFCPVVSKYCWQEQSSEECTEGNDDLNGEEKPEEESEDELLDNADATVIHNTKENEMIASKYNEECLKREQEKQQKPRENDHVEGVVEEKVIIKELNTKQNIETVGKENKEQVKSEEKERDETNAQVKDQQEREHVRETVINGNETYKEQKTLENQNICIENKEEQVELESRETKLILPATAVSLTTNVNNETLKLKAERENLLEKTNANVNHNNKLDLTNNKPTVLVARPLSIQLPILSEPPINRAHHILYASQQMLDNFQKQQENEHYQHNKSQSTQNLSKMSSPKTNEMQSAGQTQLNNNNEIMKSKFKHEEKHPNSKGFLSRFANGFRFSLRRNKKKLQKENQQQLPAEELSKQVKSNSLPPNHKPSADFIHIPLKGPLPQQNNGSSQRNNTTNGNAVKNTTLPIKQKGAKSKLPQNANNKQQQQQQQKVTGKPPIPPHQLQQLQSAQSSQQQQQPQPLVEVGFSRFYTETNNLIQNPKTATQDFLNHEQNQQQQQQENLIRNNTSQSCANHHQHENFTDNCVTQRSPENVTNMSIQNVNSNNTNNINTPDTAAYIEFTSPSRATVSQKTQMFNNLSRQSQPQPKIGLIETNLDTHETIITGKTRSLINIGPNQQQHQQRYAGNKRLHHNTSSSHQNQSGYNHDNDDDDDVYDDNDDDEVVVRPDGTVVVIKNAGNTSSSSQSAQIASVRRPHKSMEFLLDKENQKDVMPPENELQKSHDHNPAALSEHQLRIQASLQRLNIPDWFRQYNQNQKSPDGAGASTYKPGNFTRKRTQDSGRWVGLNSKTTSLSSLGSQRSDRSPLLLSPSAHSHHGGQTTQHAGQHGHSAATGTGASGGAFSRWSTSHLNSSQTSPSVSQRGSFSRGGPINSSFISVNSGHSVIRNSMRQPYLGWRSQEKLSQRTAHERLASSLLSQQQRTSPTTQTPTANTNDKLQPVTPEIQSSIKEVTSAIVHYVNDQTNQQRSRSTSPNSRKCWLESSFVGTRPLDSPQTPIIENTPLITAAQAAASSSTLLTNNNNNNLNNNNNNLQYPNHHYPYHNPDGSLNLSTFTGGNDLQLSRMNGGLNNGTSSSSTAGGVNLGVERSLSNASLEDVLASLLGLPTHQTGANASDAYARSSTGGVLVSESNKQNQQPQQLSQHMPQKQQPLQQLQQLQQQQQQQKEKENLLAISKEEQQRLRRRSEGDAATKQKQQQQQLQQQQQQQQQEQQQQEFEQKSQYYATNANKTHAASDTITSVTNTNTTANGHAGGTTTFLPPRRVSLGDSSESNNRTASASTELQIKCRNNKCDRTATPADAKKYYKSCHNCTYLYCSRECRRAHWEKHRKACLHSRVSNLCRQVLASCKDDSDSLRHLSLLARKGFLSQGRGVVRILFRSPESAEGFIKNGFQCMGEASYVRWPDLMPAEMGLELYSELLKLSTEYRPDSKMLVYVAVCVVSEAPGMGQAPVRWERQLVSRCAKLKLCKTVLAELEQQQQPLPQPVTVVAVPEPTTEVLILTFNPQLRNSTAQRELVLSNILDILSRRGVILRKHYPEIFQRLQTYAEGQTDKFNPVTLHPRDSHTGQNFVCIIMPVQSETEIIKLPSIADGGNRVTTIDVGSSAALAQLDDDELLTRTATITS